MSVSPVLSVTNEGREGFHQRLIERQARGGMDKAVEVADNVETVQRWASTSGEIEALERGRETEGRNPRLVLC